MQNNPSPDHSLATLRDHMANERTFLAWIRTSIGIMAFGFVVEKFSIFLKQIETVLGTKTLAHIDNAPTLSSGYSSIFGIVLVAFGALIALLAFFKYKKVQQHIAHESFQPTKALDILLTVTVFGIGIFLVFYLTFAL